MASNKKQPQKKVRSQETESSKRLTSMSIPISRIDLEDETFQHRNQHNLNGLIHSLEKQGQLTPIDLRQIGRRFQVLDGFRRANALKSLGKKTLKAFVYKNLSDEEGHAIAFAKNVHRLNLTPGDRALAIADARKRGLTTNQIGGLLGLSERQLGRYDKLAAYPKELRDVVDGRAVTMKHAKLIKEAGVEATVWAERIRSEKMSVSDLRMALLEFLGQPTRRAIAIVRIQKDKIIVNRTVCKKSTPRQGRAAYRDACFRILEQLDAWEEGEAEEEGSSGE